MRNMAWMDVGGPKVLRPVWPQIVCLLVAAKGRQEGGQNTGRRDVTAVDDSSWGYLVTTHPSCFLASGFEHTSQAQKCSMGFQPRVDQGRAIV